MKEKVNNINKLLSEISNIRNSNNINSGENFNVFNILGVSTSEVRLHSSFLAELLNPKGSHQLKDLFLGKFIHALSIIDESIKVEDFDTERAIIEVERFIGPKDLENSSGGFIDIYIRSPLGKSIIIENKINAGDQDKQLRRYYNFDNNAIIVYLTLDGKEAGYYTTNNDKEDVEIFPKSFSYEQDVINWLQDCLIESSLYLNIFDSIQQYIQIIKILTNQTTNFKMKNEIVDILVADGHKLLAAFEIENNVKNAKLKILKTFAERIKRDINQDDNINIKIEITSSFGLRFHGMHFKLPDIKDEFLMLSFLSDCDKCYLEFVNENNSSDGKINKTENNIKFYRKNLHTIANNWGRIEETRTGWRGDWVCRYKKMDERLHNQNFWFSIANNNFDVYVDEIVKDLKSLINVYKNKHNK